MGQKWTKNLNNGAQNGTKMGPKMGKKSKKWGKKSTKMEHKMEHKMPLIFCENPKTPRISSILFFGPEGGGASSVTPSVAPCHPLRAIPAL